MDKPEINRRAFIKSGMLLGGGLLLSFTAPLPAARRVTGVVDNEQDFSPNAYLNIKPSGVITILLTHVEMGQGIWTTLPMLIAEELDLDWKDVKVEHGPPGESFKHAVFGVQITGGSSTTWSEFDRYRQAGAVARALLVQAASKRWGVSAEDCVTANGFVINGNRKISYGELASDAAKLAVPQKVSLKDPSEWKYIGKGMKRLDSSVKTNGSAKYGMDVQAQGLLTAVVAHAPVFGGKVKSFDAKDALRVAGVRQVVQVPNGVAVIADHFWAAQQGKKLLKIVWDAGEGEKLSTSSQIAAYKKLASTDGESAAKKGDVATAFTKSAKLIEAEYVFPYLTHAPMEPLNCTVKLGEGGCEIWTGTQMPAVERDAAAKILGIAPEKVTVNTMFLGGGFGRRAVPAADFVSEAVHIAKASQKFIKMVWTREDDIKGGHYRPMYVHKLKVGTGADGMPMAWQHNIAGQSLLENTMFKPAKGTLDPTSVEGVADSAYLSSINDHFVGLHTTQEVVPTLWFRSVGHTHTAYVMETIIDELAHAAGQDPFLYRKTLLKNHPRHLSALQLAAEKAGWNKPLPAGRFHGIAVHEAFGSFVAQVVEISIQEDKLRVHKVTCAIDCGIAVNPDGVKAQMESGIIFGLTMALYGELTIDKGQLNQSNFYDYKMVRMNESPEIDVHIVPSQLKMGGAGECAVPPVAPAIANAIFAATGKRIYNLPLMNHKLV